MAKRIRRICFYGGPGSGKSSTAAWVFSELKRLGYNVEMSPEVIKPWTFIGRYPKSLDQLFLFATQVHQTDNALDGKVDLVVEDCPILANLYYAKQIDFPGFDNLLSWSSIFEEIYPALNVFLHRDFDSYSEVGRFHTRKEADVISNDMHGFLGSLFISPNHALDNMFAMGSSKREFILEHILEKLEKDN
jgi:hypothetical protein